MNEPKKKLKKNEPTRSRNSQLKLCKKGHTKDSKKNHER